MREVACFLSPSIYKANYPSFVEGLRKNGIEVECFDVHDLGVSYEAKLKERNQWLATQLGCFCQQIRPPQSDEERLQHKGRNKPEDYNFLCIAFEDSRLGVKAARKAGMCVLGIGCNAIELERLKAVGAYAVALSVSDMLQNFHVRNYYQVQYLPYAIYLKVFKKKVGYPVSLLDTLCGRFIRSNSSFNEMEEEDDDPSENDFVRSSEDSRVLLDSTSNRIIPRDVLGIEPGSLADVYINNVGWPADNVPTFHFHTRGLEMDLIRIFERFYRVPNGTTRGFVTTGGTEGNFTGLWWQRDYLRKLSHGERPILLASKQAHYSVRKAAQQLDIENLSIATLSNGAIDLSDLERTLEEVVINFPTRPVLMVVNAGTTQTGAIDNLPGVHALLLMKVPEQHFSIHLDAALMGAVLPIINPFGSDVDYFRDFNVKTIAISGHKFFGSVTICGLLLTTASFLDSCFNPDGVLVDYLQGLHDITPSGSRNGFHVVSFHNTVCGLYMHTDCRRLKTIVRQCYRNTELFLKRMSSLVGIEKVIRPDFSLQICFPRPSEDMMIKYSLMPVSLSFGDNIRYAGVCILINVTVERIDEFMSDYVRDEDVAEHLINYLQ
ncbi:histidine decarboxylase [Nitzschia inconspicua]|uniref:Histidine decarboxylase n=1 Tax=Nitzschia inconspicua TaxID=303405 RepID=A0A9K3LBW7_9STRA|nr:histidine decarboxylase [Nitzschia inconspicua]